ncbi:hypothetical protein CHL67_10170 [Prosthecochloris sp. GSB1]|uniref:glutamate-cysteine ligase family protein n=1 Tax=Prosthecochloris sp. GSB1 TaxID=281093 RepID=UPI000B8D0C6D|nr:glutamate-cysteine ligase family protein [Prosthecochloris sp. GSB1]ASQ91228.1 hypothetical protein CHL67_10170 [Prosthecochloris sp. GSB1]
MGSEISHTSFSETDFKRFRENLRRETRLLMDWFSSDSFDRNGDVCGFELEGWLLDETFLPAPRNEDFLRRVNSPLIVAELSKYNFEINADPHPLERGLPRYLDERLTTLWKTCSVHAEAMGCRVLMTGILPTVQDRMLTLENISSLQRYYALNREILRSRKSRPLNIRIEGNHDLLEITHNDVMAEAATTSLQIHLQVPPSTAARHYNAAHILSAPIVALAANAPFLFGRELWHETRIPLFEQAVMLPSFCDKNGRVISRVTFGRDYARKSLMEVFLENLDGFPVLLPVTSDEDVSSLTHLKLHNGTIWRWNRPLVGVDGSGTPHLRIEHRVPSAGPTVPDVVANMLFFFGAIHYLLEKSVPPEKEISFEEIRKNFYSAAKEGLDAGIAWMGGKTCTVRELLLEELLPGAAKALAKKGLDPADIDYYIGEVLMIRCSTGQTGSQWQKSFIGKHGPRFEDMTRIYHQNQNLQIPVHEWKR